MTTIQTDGIGAAAKVVADTILIGDVVTVDPATPRAEAVAIAGGRILSVGDRANISALRGPRTEVHDFGRAAILPGFIDTHAHMDTEGLKYARPSLEGVSSIDALIARIGALAAERPRGAWIVTMPLGTPPFYFDGPRALREGRMPTRQELDRAAPDHPVCIVAPSGYWADPPCYTALNSLALRLNGIDRHTKPRIPGIEIVHDALGEPTGIIKDQNFHESAELDLLPAVPKFTAAERREGIREAMRRYHGAGTTSVYEGHGCAPDVLDAYRALHEAGELTMRCALVGTAIWSSLGEADDAMRHWLVPARGRGFGDSMLRLSGVYLQYGGDRIGPAIERERRYDTGFWSHLRQALDPSEFEPLCVLAAEHGLRVHTIVSNGRLADTAPIFRRVDARHSIRDRRWVVEHLSLSRLEDLQLVKVLGVGVTLIPNYHLWKRGAQFFDLSEAEQELSVPAKQLLALGIPVGAGSDNSPYNPLAVMRALILRQERTTGRVIGAKARLSAEEALDIVTAQGAWFSHEEHVKGRLKPGYFADIAVLDANPLRVSPETLDTIACRATMVGGRFVHYRS